MADLTNRAHPSWEDWASMMIGALIIVSPWIAQIGDLGYATLNAVLIGLLVIMAAWLEVAWMEFMAPQIWEEWVELVLGLWLAVSPWIFGYSQLMVPTTMHVVFGGLVAVLALAELWQDRALTARPYAS
jgi:hypothetical protein